MINVSSGFKSQMNNNRNFVPVAEITLTDGNTLTLTEDELSSANNSIVDGAGVSSFPVGVAVQKYITLEFLNPDDMYKEYNFFGAKIRYYFNFELEDGTVEKIEKGTYTVISPESHDQLISLTAYDDMYRADKTYSTNLVFPQTAAAVLREICSTCDINLGSTEFLHDDFVIQTAPTDCTFRDVIGYIAMIACGNARIDVNNKLRIITYDLSGWDSSLTLDEWSSPTIDYNPSAITGFRTSVTVYDTDDDGYTSESESSLLVGTDDYVVDIDNPLIDGSESTVLQWLYDTLANISFYPFSGDLISNPLIEFMDLVKCENWLGELKQSFVTDINFIVDGYTTAKNAAPTADMSNAAYSTDVSKATATARKLVEAEKTDREQAIDALNKTLNEASGMYVTEETQPDGSTITYLHDKKSLSDSTNIIKITSDAIGISNNGGQTYPYGIDLDGTFIANQLYSVGVNANYINTGALTIKDSDGNIIFSADVDTGTVYISGDNVTIGGGKTLNDALEEFSENAKNLTISLSNDYQAIGVDSDGNYDTFPDCSTTVTVMYGSLNVSNACTYSYLTSDSITGEWNGSTRTYTVKGLSADTGWVDITATYNTALKVTKRFSIGKVYDGADGQTYMLDSDISVFKTDRDGTKLSVKSVTFSAYKQNAGGGREPYSGRFVIKAIGKSYTQTIYTSSTDESEILEYLDTGLATKGVSQYISGWKYWGAEPLADADGSILLTDNVLSAYSQDVESIQCELYAAGGTTTLIDKMLINRVIDVSLLDQEDVYNLLTNNGKWQGIYKNSDGNMYINFSYAHGGTLKLGGQNNMNGSLTVYDASGNQVGYWNKDGINATKGTFSGNLNAAGGTFNGDISASSGTFKGNVKVVGSGDTYSDYYIEMSNGAGKTSPYLVMAYQDDEYIDFGDDDEEVEFEAEAVSTASSTPEIIAQLDGVNGLVANKGSFKGTINATSGYFKGKITTTSGSIGGWSISSGSITSSSGGMILRKSGTITNGKTELSFDTYSLEIDGGLYVNVKYNSESGLVSDGGGINFNGLQTGTIAYQLGMLSGHIAVCRSSSSSKRYKDIERDMTFDDVESLFNIQPVMAKYKDGYLVRGDQLEGKFMPMFIAENVEEHFPEAVLYDDGQVEDWNYRVMIPAMFQMIKSQKNTIDSLTERIEKLESLIQKGEN